MRNRCGMFLCLGFSAVVVVGLSACAAKAPMKPAGSLDLSEETPMPTVARRTPTPEPTGAPLPTRPVGKNIKPTKGHPIGPVITFFGAARADGRSVDPHSVDKQGIPTYLSSAGSGFILVVEAKPGEGGFEPARSVFNYDPRNPNMRPDLQIETSRKMGDGSREVCDKRKPNIGGIPAIHPPSFKETQQVSDTLNDLACRFETFLSSDSACTAAVNGEFSFVAKDSMTQFCMIVARAWAFPVGDTLLTVRLLDSEGNPGPVKQMRIHRPPEPKKTSAKPNKKN